MEVAGSGTFADGDRHQRLRTAPGVHGEAGRDGRLEPSTSSALGPGGRDLLPVDDGLCVGLHGAERSIIDAFHARGTTGTDLAVEALRRWLRRQGSQPGELLAIAARWPRAQARLQRPPEVLL